MSLRLNRVFPLQWAQVKQGGRCGARERDSVDVTGVCEMCYVACVLAAKSRVRAILTKSASVVASIFSMT